MKVSVAIAAFNAADYLREAISSALNQTLQPDEIVVVDDGSKDHTAEVCKSFGSRVKYVYQEKDAYLGATAHLRAILESSGELIAFLDHDDRWLPTKLEKQVAALEESPEAGIVFTLTRPIDKDGNISGPTLQTGPSGDAFHDLLTDCRYYFSSGVVRRSVLANVGLSSIEMSSGDWDLWLRIARHHPFKVVEEVLSEYRIYPTNFCSNRIRLAKATRQIMQYHSTRLHENCDECRRSLRIGMAIPGNMMADVARKHLDDVYDSASNRKFSEACSHFWEAIKTSPREVVKPRRLAAVAKNMVRAILV